MALCAAGAIRSALLGGGVLHVVHIAESGRQLCLSRIPFHQVAEVNITIGIPSYNEAANIGALLEQLSTDSVAPHILREIIVADESDDETPAIVAASARRYPVVRLVRKSGRTGVGAAMNIIFAEAKGDVIVRVDADVAIESGTVKALAGAIAAGATMSTGACDPIRQRKNLVSLGARFGSLLVLELQAGPYSANHVVGRLFGVRTDAVRDLHVWADIIAEDYVIMQSVRQKGGSVRFVPEARCSFLTPTTFADYWRQSRRAREGGRQLHDRLDFQETPLREIFRAVMRTALRHPVAALTWAAMYSLSSLLPTPTKASPWPISATTKFGVPSRR
jgi:glycosyltransferase involved in cell wall biosynthesis